MTNLLYNLYKWLIAIPILIILTIITALLTMFGSPIFGGKWWGYFPPHIWSKLVCWILFIKVEVRNRELIDRNTSYVFIANHQGAFDIFTIYGFLGHNFKWMMKKSLEKIPLIGSACKNAGHIMVDRSSPSAIKRTMDIAKKRLSNGMSLVIFPEGARSWNGKMRPFKKGAFKLALDFNLPIIPLTIDGSFGVLPRTTLTKIKPGKIILTIHEPISFETECYEIDKIMTDSFSVIQSSLPEVYQVDLPSI